MLLADEGFTGFHGSSLGFLVLAIAAGVVWLVVFGWRWFATRPRMPEAGLETREVGPEAPVLVNLLVNRWCATRSSIQATLMDLASRKYLAIDMYGEDHYVVRIRRDPPNEKLTAYERQLLDLVHQKATGGSAPAEALTLGDEKQAQSWWQRFRKSVADDAKANSLARVRWAPRDWVILGAVLAVVLLFLSLSFGLAHVGGRDSSGENSLDPEDWLGIGFVAWLGSMAVLSRMRDLRDTPTGREACARWLGVRNYLREINAFDDVPAAAVIMWERFLAYGVALGVARDAMHQLPLAADDPDIAWSRYTGTWRQIRIEFPARFGYGGWPLGVFAGGLARVLFWGSITFVLLPVLATVSWNFIRDGLSSETRDTFAIEAAFVLVFVGIALIPLINLINGLIRMFLGGSDLISRPQTVEGIVVKLHEGKVAVDDGDAEEVRAWQPNPASPSLSLGYHIRATMSPHLAHVTSVEVISAPAPVLDRHTAPRVQ